MSILKKIRSEAKSKIEKTLKQIEKDLDFNLWLQLLQIKISFRDFLEKYQWKDRLTQEAVNIVHKMTLKEKRLKRRYKLIDCNDLIDEKVKLTFELCEINREISFEKIRASR